jgi:N-acetylglucosamine-6-phosphate deacetylase
MKTMITLIHNASIYLPQQILAHGWLLISDGIIEKIGVGEPPLSVDGNSYDAQGRKLLPGFIDIHVHGAMGHESMDASPEGLISMAKFYAQHGVTSFLPTTWAAPFDRLLPVFDTIRSVMGMSYAGAQILGAHVEGPFIHPAKAGAQNPNAIYPPSRTLIDQLIAQEIVKLVTLAPEIPENQQIIPLLWSHGVAVSAGHTTATYEDMEKAVELGVTSVTHTFNAMPPLHHREPGAVGAALLLDALCCEVIADNIHLHPAILNMVARLKTADKMILVTDAIRGTGLPDGEYPIDERTLTIKNGEARLPNGSLAGSTLTMERAFHNMLAATNWSIDELLPAATLTPARLIGVQDRKGSIEIGKDADLIIIDDDINIVNTFVKGNLVH